LGWWERDQPVTVHLRYLFRLISSHPYSSSGLCTRPIIYYSTVCIAPFFRRLCCVVFLPFPRNQLLTSYPGGCRITSWGHLPSRMIVLSLRSSFCTRYIVSPFIKLSKFILSSFSLGSEKKLKSVL
jgi:hypothetical protein